MMLLQNKEPAIFTCTECGSAVESGTFRIAGNLEDGEHRTTARCCTCRRRQPCVSTPLSKLSPEAAARMGLIPDASTSA